MECTLSVRLSVCPFCSVRPVWSNLEPVNVTFHSRAEPHVMESWILVEILLSLLYNADERRSTRRFVIQLLEVAHNVLAITAALSYVFKYTHRLNDKLIQNEILKKTTFY